MFDDVLVEEPLDTDIVKLNLLSDWIVLPSKACFRGEAVVDTSVVFQNLKLIKTGVAIIIDVPGARNSSGGCFFRHELDRCAEVKLAQKNAQC